MKDYDRIISRLFFLLSLFIPAISLLVIQWSSVLILIHSSFHIYPTSLVSLISGNHYLGNIRNNYANIYQIPQDFLVWFPIYLFNLDTRMVGIVPVIIIGTISSYFFSDFLIRYWPQENPTSFSTIAVRIAAIAASVLYVIQPMSAYSFGQISIGYLLLPVYLNLFLRVIYSRKHYLWFVIVLLNSFLGAVAFWDFPPLVLLYLAFPLILLIRKKDFFRFLGRYCLQTILLIAFSVPTLLGSFSTQVSGSNPFSVHYSALGFYQLSPTVLSAIVKGFDLATNDLIRGLTPSMYLGTIFFFVFLITAVLIRDNRNIRVLTIWTLYLLFYSRFLPFQGNSIIVAFEGIKGLSLVGKTFAVFEIPSSISSFAIAMSLFLVFSSVIVRYSRDNVRELMPKERKIIINRNLKFIPSIQRTPRLYVILVVLLFVLSGLSIASEASIIKEVGGFSAFADYPPEDAGYYSHMDAETSSWLFQHVENSAVIWLPYSNSIYPYSFELTSYLGNKVVTYPRYGTDGSFDSSYFQFTFLTLLKSNDTYLFAKYLAIAGVQYVVVSAYMTENYLNAAQTTLFESEVGMTGPQFLKVLNGSSGIFTLIRTFGLDFIFINNVYEPASSGSLGYNSGGLLGLSLYYQFQKESNALFPRVNFSPLDMNSSVPVNIYNGTILFTQLSSIYDILASQIMGDSSLYSNAIIPIENLSESSHVGFNTAIGNWWYAQRNFHNYLYQDAYIQNYPYIYNLQGKYYYNQSLVVQKGGDYVMLVRYLAGNGTGNLTLNLNGFSYSMPRVSSFFSGMIWSPLSLNLAVGNYNLGFILNGTEAINSIILLNLSEYNVLLTQAESILQRDSVDYLTHSSPGNTTTLTLPNMGNYTVYVVADSIGNLTINGNSSNQVLDFSSDIVSQSSLKVKTNLTLSSTTSCLILLVQDKAINSPFTVMLSQFFEFPENQRNAFLFGGISLGFVT